MDIFYRLFPVMNFTLTFRVVNVDFISTRAYISQGKGIQVLNMESLMLDSFKNFVDFKNSM